MGCWNFRNWACSKYPPSPGRPGRFSSGWPPEPYRGSPTPIHALSKVGRAKTSAKARTTAGGCARAKAGTTAGPSVPFAALRSLRMTVSCGRGNLNAASPRGLISSMVGLFLARLESWRFKDGKGKNKCKNNSRSLTPLTPTRTERAPGPQARYVRDDTSLGRGDCGGAGGLR